MEEINSKVGFELWLNRERIEKFENKCRELNLDSDNIYRIFTNKNFSMILNLRPDDFRTYLNARIDNFIETGNID